MAARKPPSTPKSANLSVDQMRAGVVKIQRRIDELKAFDIRSVLGRSDPNIGALQQKIESTLQDIFGVDTVEYHQYGNIRLSTLPLIMGSEPFVPEIQNGYREGIKRAVISLTSLKELFGERIMDSSPAGQNTAPEPVERICGRRVFIVHGHDDGMKETVARYIAKLGLDPVILHEQANQGKTIIEKFEQHAMVDFAVVLFSPDDVGHEKAKPADQKARARQNVVLELGFFMGALKRHKVCAIVQDGIEKPSDYDGVLYIPFDAGGSWRFQLAKEIKASGIDVDMNRAV
jgi:predicted nucleotide-binding protein